jgi:hypothetical protein
MLSDIADAIAAEAKTTFKYLEEIQQGVAEVKHLRGVGS